MKFMSVRMSSWGFDDGDDDYAGVVNKHASDWFLERLTNGSIRMVITWSRDLSNNLRFSFFYHRQRNLIRAQLEDPRLQYSSILDERFSMFKLLFTKTIQKEEKKAKTGKWYTPSNEREGK